MAKAPGPYKIACKCGGDCKCKPDATVPVARSAASFNVLAFQRGPDTPGLNRRRLPLNRLDKAVQWAVGHGCDSILLELTDEPAIDRSGVVTHVMCSDLSCPGGC